MKCNEVGCACNNGLDMLSEEGLITVFGDAAKSAMRAVLKSISSGIDRSFEAGASCEKYRIALELLKEGSLSYKEISRITKVQERNLKCIDIDKTA